MNGKIILAATFSVAAVLSLGACSGTSSTSVANATKSQASKAKNSEPFQHAEDVKLLSCKLDPNPYSHTALASVRITNSSSKPSDYDVTVAFQSVDGKTQLDTGTAFAQRLLPAQTTTQEADGTTTLPTGQKFKCVISGVDRTSAVG